MLRITYFLRIDIYNPDSYVNYTFKMEHISLAAQENDEQVKT